MSDDCIGRLGHDDGGKMYLILADQRAFLDEKLRNEVIEKLDAKAVKLDFTWDVHGDEDPKVRDWVSFKDWETAALIIPLPDSCSIHAEVVTDIQGIRRIGEIRIRCSNSWEVPE